MTKLEQIAKNIVKGGLVPSFSTVYVETSDVDAPPGVTPSDKLYWQYQGFKEALRSIAVDLHLIGISGTDSTKVQLQEFRVARQSTHWSDEVWLVRNVETRIPFLTKDAAISLITDMADVLAAHVTVFNERSERWTQLASFAHLYEIEGQLDFVTRATECLIGYGWRKDLWGMDVLDAVVQVSEKDPASTMARLDALVPIIDMITEFTDGDETNHIRSELIDVVAKIAPERLPSLYEHHLSLDEYSYADECLITIANVMDLNLPECAALVRTFLDDKALLVLENRAASEPVAQRLFDHQNAFLGRTPELDREAAATEEKATDPEEAFKTNPASFGCKEFAKVVKTAADIDYRDRREFLAKWLIHCQRQANATIALNSIRAYIDSADAIYIFEEILDEAFAVSLAVEGKDAAYPWLVKAHIYRHGWETYYTSEAEVIARLTLAAQHYPDQWSRYIRDTSVPSPYFRRRGYSFVLGYKYIVRYLIMVNQLQLADEITDALVNLMVEEVREQPIPKAAWFH